MITFYATISSDYDTPSLHASMPAVPLLVPASSWERVNFRVPRLPAHIPEVAADSGGFVATLRAQKLGIVDGYTYTPERYVAWLKTFHPSWAATMDYCCEDEITSQRPGVVRDRQDRTTAMAWHFWRTYRRVPWPWVPTIQGWTLSDYQYHAREMAPSFVRWPITMGQGAIFAWELGRCAAVPVPQ